MAGGARGVAARQSRAATIDDEDDGVVVFNPGRQPAVVPATDEPPPCLPSRSSRPPSPSPPPPPRSPPPPRGLANVGNSCYANALLQALASGRYLPQQLSAHTAFEGRVTVALRQFLEQHGAPRADGASAATPPPRSVRARHAAASSVQSGTPADVLRAVAVSDRRFGGREQQDSHDLLRALMDAVLTEETDARKAQGAGSAARAGASVGEAEGAPESAPSPDAPADAAGPGDDDDDARARAPAAEGATCSRAPAADEPDEPMADRADDGGDEAAGARAEPCAPAALEASAEPLPEPAPPLARALPLAEAAAALPLAEAAAALPLVEAVFGGELRAHSLCLTCGAVSCRAEGFLDISLPLPEELIPVTVTLVAATAGLAPGAARAHGGVAQRALHIDGAGGGGVVRELPPRATRAAAAEPAAVAASASSGSAAAAAACALKAPGSAAPSAAAATASSSAAAACVASPAARPASECGSLGKLVANKLRAKEAKRRDNLRKAKDKDDKDGARTGSAADAASARARAAAAAAQPRAPAPADAAVSPAPRASASAHAPAANAADAPAADGAVSALADAVAVQLRLDESAPAAAPAPAPAAAPAASLTVARAEPTLKAAPPPAAAAAAAPAAEAPAAFAPAIPIVAALDAVRRSRLEPHAAPAALAASGAVCARASIEGCFSAFLREEVLPAGYDCDTCTLRAKEAAAREARAGPPPAPRQPAVRWYALARPPSTLTLHLMRFAASRGRLVKVSAHVSFPLLLSLRPFCAANSSPPRHLDDLQQTQQAQQAQQARRAAASHWKQRARGAEAEAERALEAPAPGLQQRHDYELSAVVVHQGSMRGGHYTAYVCARAAKGAGDAPAASRWFHISDTRVSKAEEADVLGAQAFLLFYDRV